MIRHAMLLGLKDHALLSRRQPIKQLLKADDVILAQVPLRKCLQPALLVIGAVSIDDWTHEKIYRQQFNTSPTLINDLRLDATGGLLRRAFLLMQIIIATFHWKGRYLLFIYFTFLAKVLEI